MTSQQPTSRWERWHEDYADPRSFLSRRLAVVQQRLTELVDSAPQRPVRLVSVCAGQAHDVVGALREHPRRDAVSGRLVELDPANAHAARAALADAGLTGFEVVEADAGLSSSYVGAVPADIVLLCGVFGNVSDDDVERTALASSSLCAPGAGLIWTRHRRAPDLTPSIRSWFEDAGFNEIAFDSPGADGFAVGTLRLVRQPPPLGHDQTWFTFA